MTARALIVGLAIAGIAPAVAAQNEHAAAWDSVRMTYEPFCQIGTCTGYRLSLSSSRQFSVRGTGNPIRREMAQQRFENVTTLVDEIVWRSLPTSVIVEDGRIGGICAAIMTHQPSYIVELFQGSQVARITDSHWCTSVRDVSDSDHLAAASFRKLRLLESVLGTVPEAQTAARPTTAPLDYRQIAGCYALVLGEWSAPTQYQPPRTFNLKATGADTSSDGTIFRPVSPNPSMYGSFSPQWAIRAVGSIEVFWSTGFAGVRLTLWPENGQKRRATLEGHATVFTDLETAAMQQPTVPAKARRVSCSAGPVQRVQGIPP
jgi:hypothetical protein